MSTSPPEQFRVSADLWFVPTEQAGRRTPVCSQRYRPACWFGRMRGAEREYSDCLLTLVGGDTFEHDGALWARPGAVCQAELVPAFAAHVREYVAVGRTFDVCEGAQVVARGSVTAVHDPGAEHDWRPTGRDS